VYNYPLPPHTQCDTPDIYYYLFVLMYDLICMFMFVYVYIILYVFIFHICLC